MSLERAYAELCGFDEGELVLRIPRRDDDQSAHRAFARVPNGVHRPTRNKHKPTSGDPMFAVSKQERRLAIGNVERFISVRVEVNRRTRFARRERADLSHVGATHLNRAEVGDWIVGRGDDGAPVNRLHHRASVCGVRDRRQRTRQPSAVREWALGCASVLSLESCSALCHHVAQINADLTDGLSPVSYDR